MRWHYDALLGLPLSVYVALLAWAQEQTKQSQLDLDELE